MKKKYYKILLSGGGTGGSVMPLLSVADELKKRGNYNFLWLGGKSGPEKEMAGKEGIEFRKITNGKLRRYFSWQNFGDIFLIIAGFFQSLWIILRWQPDLVMSAGSFISVPVVWAAWFLSVPVLIHQQDVRPGLANRLMAPFANAVTVTFKKSLKKYGMKAVWTGNPVRRSLEFPITDPQFLNIDRNLPVVLIIGGGTGAKAINEMVEKAINELVKFCQIIHVTGRNKGKTIFFGKADFSKRYHDFEFLDVGQMAKAYTISDMVVSRCGMGALTELSYLGKPSILIPMPNSHQEDNAKIFGDEKAAIILEQGGLSAEKLVNEVKKILNDELLRDKLSNNIKNVIKTGANEKIVEIIIKIIGNKK